MNKDQVQGIAKKIVGTVQEKSGKFVGSKTQQLKGLQKQVDGKADIALGNTKKFIHDAKAPLTRP